MMPSNCTPTDEYYIKPHEPWCQDASIYLFQEKISNLNQIRLEYERTERHIDDQNLLLGEERRWS